MSEVTRFLFLFLGADDASGSITALVIAAELTECFFFSFRVSALDYQMTPSRRCGISQAALRTVSGIFNLDHEKEEKMRQGQIRKQCRLPQSWSQPRPHDLEPTKDQFRLLAFPC